MRAWKTRVGPNRATTDLLGCTLPSRAGPGEYKHRDAPFELTRGGDKRS